MSAVPGDSSPAQPKFGLQTSVAVVLSNIIGVGVFTSLGFQIAEFRSGFVLLFLWLVGGVIALCGAFTYAELGARYPKSGGDYNYLREAMHPSLGFAAGLTSMVMGFGAPIALVAITFGEYLSAAVPVIPSLPAALTVLVVGTLLHLFTYGTSSTSHTFFTYIKLLLIVLFCVACLVAVPQFQAISFVPQFTDVSLVFSGSFAVALVFVNYSYLGWAAVNYMSGDLRTDKNVLTNSLLIGTLIVCALYLLLNFTFLVVAPLDLMDGQIEIGFIVAQQAFSEQGAIMMGVALAVMLIATVSGMILAGSRIIQRVGEDEPLVAVFARTNSKFIPWVAIIVLAIVALIFLLSGTFEDILLYAGFALGLNSFLTVFSVFVMRHRDRGAHKGYTMPWYPLPPVLFLVLMAGTLFYLAIEEPTQSILGALTYLSGIGLYYVLRGSSKLVKE